MQTHQHSFIVDRLGEFYEHARYNRGLSDKTVNQYARVIRLLCQFAKTDDPSAIPPEQLHGFTGLHLHNLGVRPRARRAYVAAIHTFYKWLSPRAGIANPAIGLPYPQIGRPLPTYATEATIERLIMAQDIATFSGLRNVFMLYLLACGLRVSALTGLNEEDLIFEHQALTVRIRTKRMVEAFIPVPDEVWVIARAYLGILAGLDLDRTSRNGNRILFPAVSAPSIPKDQWHGERVRISRQGVLHMIVTTGTRLGLPRDQLHPHALRHAFGMALSRADISTLTRMKLMAHASPASSEVYDHMTTHEARKAIEKADLFANMVTPGKELLARLKADKKKPGTGPG